MAIGKSRYGVGVKKTPPRSGEEIDKEYQFNALNVGHKMALIKECEDQILVHTSRMLELRKEKPAASEVKQYNTQTTVQQPL